ncbi:MAG: acylphosphatase [Saprospiraceae bacterium]|nr:acylphosphatase [Saprospiraceae bacterium]
MRQVRLHIIGKVQGVWFRVHTRDQARALQLTGWVQNEPDGSVTIVACGPENKIQQLIDWSHQGSPLSRVEKVICSNEHPEAFDRFDIQ